MKHDLNDMRLFVRIVQAGGYASASRQTGVPRATLSRRIVALEEDLGLRLIERSSRSFRMTQSGQALFERAQDVVAAAEAAFECVDAGAAAPRGIVRFAVPPSLLHLRLDRMVLAYMGAHPEVVVQIESTNRRVDLLREGFDFAVRARQSGAGPLDQVIVPLAAVDHILVVSPQLAPLLGPTLADSLTRIPPLAWAPAGQPASWRLRDAAGQIVRLNLTPRLTVEDMAMQHQAAVAGLGIALLPKFMAVEALASGALILVSLDAAPLPGRIHAVHLGHKGMRPAVRHLLDWLKREYRELC